MPKNPPILCDASAATISLSSSKWVHGSGMEGR